jgi:HK97 family phage prohead protease
MAEMSAAQINDLPDSAFAYIEPGGSKDEQGKTVPRSKRHFPIHDAAHVRNALARAPQSPFGDKAMPKIRAAAKKFGIEMSDETSASRADENPFLGPQLFVRSYPLEDIRILSRAQGSEYADGRTVEAYVAVFDREAEVQDHEGHYREIIDRTAFNKAIADARPQGGRQAWRAGVFYNHGMTLFGTPSDRFSVPLGSPQDIRVEDHGLLTITRYNATPLADEILEAIRSGDITGHSFTGRIIRSDPARPPSRRGYTRRSDGTLGTVRRLEMGLREYGPTPFPVYADAAVVGVRSMLAGLSLPALLSATRQTVVDELVESGMEPEEAVRAVTEEPADSDTSAPNVEAVTDEPPPNEGHSSRSELLQRIAAAKTIRPGLGARPEGGS